MRLALTFFAILLLHSAAARAFDACQVKDTAHYVPVLERESLGLFYRLTRCGETKDNYLLGTIHADDVRIRQAVKPAIKRLLESDAAYFEFIEPANAELIAKRYMLLPPGKSLPDYIGQEAFAALSNALKMHSAIPVQATRQFKPWAAASLLHYPPTTYDGKVLDLFLQNLAHSVNVPLKGLESFKEQLALFDTLDGAVQRDLVNETIRLLPDLASMHEAIIAYYLRNDLTRLHALSEENLEENQSPELQEFMEQKLVNQRNQKMAKRSLAALKQGNQFIAVGALHLPGRTGLLSAYENAGYYVVDMPLIATEAPDKSIAESVTESITEGITEVLW